jgi:hypothetical protein
MIGCCFQRIINNYLPFTISGGNRQISLPKNGEEPKNLMTPFTFFTIFSLKNGMEAHKTLKNLDEYRTESRISSESIIIHYFICIRFRD